MSERPVQGATPTLAQLAARVDALEEAVQQRLDGLDVRVTALSARSVVDRETARMAIRGLIDRADALTRAFLRKTPR